MNFSRVIPGAANTVRALAEVVVATAAILGICEYFHPNFFFRDESARQYGPIFQYIGKALLQGEWPLLTLDVLQGGYLLGENQYGLLNPFTMTAAATAGLMPTVKTGALLFTAIHLALLWLGASRLALNLGVGGLARLTFAFIVISNNLLLYWYASSWTAGLIGQTWFVWSLALLAAPRLNVMTILLGAFSVYAALNSGWPHTLLATVVMVSSAGIASLIRRDWERLAGIAIITTSSAIASLLSIAPLVDTIELTSRQSGYWNNWVLVPMLSDILNVGAPSYLPRLNNWSETPNISSTPVFFLAWFALAALPLFRLNWRSLASTPMLGIGISTAILLVASLGPEQVAMLRWPLRFAPHAQVGLLAGLLVLLRGSKFRSPTLRTVMFCIALAVGPQILAVLAAPAQISTHIAFATVLTFTVLIANTLIEWRPGHFWAFCLFSSVLFFLLTHHFFPLNRDVYDAGVKEQDPIRYNSIFFKPIDDNKFSYTFSFLQNPGGISLLLSGYLRLTDSRMLNGYSSVDRESLSKLLCLDPFGTPCDSALSRLFGKEEETGMAYLNLLRVDRLLVPTSGTYWALSAATVTPDWHEVSRQGNIAELVRVTPTVALPGTLSYAGAELTVARDAHSERIRANSETVHIHVAPAPPAGSGSPLERALVFARLWWPGYVADIEGRDIPVVAHNDLLVRIDIPPHVSGKVAVRLSFRPLAHGIRPFYIPLGLALLATGCFVVIRLRGSRLDLP